MKIILFKLGKNFDHIFLILFHFSISLSSTHHDEMCNVYAMYSYDPSKSSDDKSTDGLAPLSNCWGDSFNQKSS